jgi:hypothetical protein
MNMDNKVKKDIISKLDIEGLPKKKIDKITKQLEEHIQRKLVLEVLNLLKIEDRKKLEKLIGDNKKISIFLQEKIPTIGSLIKAVAESVVKEFKNFIR